jgi:hypothetical protein
MHEHSFIQLPKKQLKQKTNMYYIFTAMLLVNFVENQGIFNYFILSFFSNNKIYKSFKLSEVQVIPPDQIDTDHAKGTLSF